MSDAITLTCPCPDAACAQRIGRAAVEARLAACANLHGPMTSIYHWQGTVEQATEWQMHLKSRAGCLPDLVALIRRLHPYDLPAITWTACGTDPDTAAWIAAETALGR